MGAVCVGQPTIDKLAADGAVSFENGVGLVAADDLYHASPYARLTRAEGIIRELVRAWDSTTLYPTDRIEAALQEADEFLTKSINAAASDTNKE